MFGRIVVHPRLPGFCVSMSSRPRSEGSERRSEGGRRTRYLGEVRGEEDEAKAAWGRGAGFGTSVRGEKTPAEALTVKPRHSRFSAKGKASRWDSG
jgi:hypothetical protein